MRDAGEQKRAVNSSIICFSKDKMVQLKRKVDNFDRQASSKLGSNIDDLEVMHLYYMPDNITQIVNAIQISEQVVGLCDALLGSCYNFQMDGGILIKISEMSLPGSQIV